MRFVQIKQMKIEMTMRHFSIFILMFFFSPLFAYGASDILILPLMNQKSIKKKQVQTFEKLLEQNLNKEGISFVSTEQSIKKLKLTTAKVKKCIKDIQCLAQSGQKLGSSFVLSGYLGQKGNQPFASINLINASNGEREKNWKFKIPTSEKEYPKVIHTFTSEVVAIIQQSKPKPAKVLTPQMTAAQKTEPKQEEQAASATDEEGNVTPLPDKDEPLPPKPEPEKDSSASKSSIQWDNYWAWGFIGTSALCVAGGGIIFQSALGERNQYLGMTTAQQKSPEGQTMKNSIYGKVSQTNILLITSGVTAIGGVTLLYFGWGSSAHPFFSIKGPLQSDIILYPTLSPEYSGLGAIMRY